MKKISLVSVGFVVVLVGMFVWVRPANAISLTSITTDVILFLVDGMVNIYVYFVGSLLTSVLIPVLTAVASYNDFLTNPVISIGWALVRDLVNMLFIVALLIIAFSTMLRIQTYHYKTTLVRLILMVILVNFSKLFAGVLIDFFQVVMLTFVNGFKSAAGGNIIQAFHIYEMLTLASGVTPTGQQVASDPTTDLAITGGLILAAVGLTVVVLIIMIFIVVLLFRIVMLWLLVAISPLAYFAYVIRPNYWSQWWGEFFKQLTTGPTIAFFLWLILLTAQRQGGRNFFDPIEVGQQSLSDVPLSSGFALPNIFINYITLVALSFAGLTVAQKMASQTGTAAAKVASKVQSAGTKAAVIGSGAILGKKAYDWGSRRVKAFQSMRENIKQQRAQQFAASAMNRYGKAKDKTIGAVGRTAQRGFNRLTGRTRLQRLDDLISRQQRQIEVRRRRGQNTVVQEQRLAQLQRARTATNYRNLVGERILGRVTGLRPMLRMMSESGLAEQQQVRTYKASEVNKYSSEMKAQTGQENMAIFENQTENAARRTAALFQAIEQGEGDAGQADYYREEVRRMHGNDETVNNMLEAAIDKHMPSASRREIPEGTPYYQTALERQWTKLSQAGTDELQDTGSVLRAFSDEQGNLNYAQFNSSRTGMSRGHRQVLVDQLDQTARDTSNVGMQRRAIQALYSMGEMQRVQGEGGIAEHLQARGMDEHEVNTLIRSSINQDKDAVVKATIQQAGSLDINSVMRLADEDQNGESIMTGASRDAFIQDVVFKTSTADGANGRTNGEMWLEQAIASGNDRAAATVISHMGDLRVLDTMAPGDRQNVMHELSRIMNPNVLSRLRFSRASVGTQDELIREMLSSGLDIGTIAAADNKRKSEKKSLQEIDVLLQHLGAMATSSPTTGAPNAHAAAIFQKADDRKDTSDLHARMQ